MTPVVVLTTVGASFDSAALASELVEQRVAACVNIVEKVRSIYRWNDAIEQDSEQLLIIKTVEERVDDLRRVLLARHPYQVPEFIVVRPDRLSDAYQAWLIASTE